MKGKIVLINPPSSVETEFGVLAGGGGFRPPLNVIYLASVLREKLYEVEIIDAPVQCNSYLELVEKVRAAKPDYCGITAMTLTIHPAAKTADMIKLDNPKCPIIIGGAHLSAAPEETMNMFTSFDYGVIGEGEDTLPELLEAIREKRDVSKIPGIIYRTDSGLRRAAARPMIQDLDNLPFPAWDLLPNYVEIYKPSKVRQIRLPSAYLATSRGCPFQCVFCDNVVHGHTFRSYSVDYIMRMIYKLIQDYNIKDLTIYDENLTINRKRITEFCERIIREGLDLTWSCDARADSVTPELLELMYRAGCRSISYGIESGSQEVLDFYKKRLTLEKIEYAVRETKKAGIISSGFFIIGGPTETEETINKTITFAKKIPLDYFTPFYFNCFPNSPIYDRIAEYGEFDPDYSKANMSKPVFIPKGLTQKRLVSLFNKALFSFYLRPSKVLFLIRHLGFSFVMRQINMPFLMLKERLRLSFQDAKS